MCNLNLPLVAWIDGELPASEAVAVAHHVQGCTDCRAHVSEYENASREFAGYYTAATRAACAIKPPRRVPSWVPFAAAAAAKGAQLGTRRWGFVALTPRVAAV